MSLDLVTDYALSFGGDAVHLQKRERPAAAEAGARQPAWRHLGSVDFDEPDFPAMLVNLRMMATGQPAAEPMNVLLVIPDDQILYTTLTVAPSGDPTRAVARALDGLTPYAIEDLAFDWRGEGDSVRVAAVARQTLLEARDFAAQYGFQGEAFCADPEAGLFPGEPAFVLAAPVRPRLPVDPVNAGVTASELLIEDEPVCDDSAAPASEAEAAAGTPAQAASVEPPADQSAPLPVTEPAPEVASEPAATPGPAVSPPVVRHVPARPPVPQGPDLPEAESQLLTPRARAIHRRAAEARYAKPAGAADPVAPARPAKPQRRGPGHLPLLLAILLAGLALLWAFLGPDDESAPLSTVLLTIPEPADPAPAAALPVAPSVSDPVPAIDPAPPAATPAAHAAAPEAEPVTAAPQPQPVAQSVPEVSRRVLVAASATAAAVVLSGPSAEAKSEPQAKAVVSVKSAQPDAASAKTAPAKAEPAPVAAPVATAPRLTVSARPQLSPRRSTPQTTTPQTDAAPRVPQSPLPYAASLTNQPERSARPPKRQAPVARSDAAQTRPSGRDSASADPVAARPFASAGGRPPQRPEGAAPDQLADEGLAADDQRQLAALILDLDRHGLIATKPVPRTYGPRFAEARPKRKPVSDAVSAAAVEDAVKEAAGDKPARSSASAMQGSSRPSARPGNRASTAAVSDDAVNKAIAAAVDASPAIPNATKLASSPLPPRRSGAAPAAADADDKPATDPAPAAAAAAAPEVGPSEAEMAARRAMDEQLQAQAEARIRARAQADAAAEAQARAQAEARARAQVEAEERAAQSRKQAYKPQEIDDEPEITSGGRGGATSASVASNATQRRGMDPGRTTIIGVIGAGNASRALIRLRNGKIVTVRLGDKINGGTINSIGNGRLTYVKGGRTGELRMLDGK